MRRMLFICLTLSLMWIRGGAAQTDGGIVPVDQGRGDLGALTRMHDYLQQRPAVEFKTSFRETSDLPGMGRSGTAHFFIKRPESFRIELSSGKEDYLFISDGTTLTIYRPNARKYARIPSKDSMIGTMYTAIGLLGTQAKLIDFIWTIDYGEQVSSKAIGSQNIGEETCDRFSVQRFEQQWDVWLRKDGAPVPCRIVSRKLDANDRTVQTNEFAWVDTPAFGQDLFLFTPPADAVEVGPSEIE